MQLSMLKRHSKISEEMSSVFDQNIRFLSSLFTAQWWIQTFRQEGGGGGTQSSRPWDKGGRSPKQFFLALQASFLSKNKEGAPPPGPSPGSAPLHVRWWVCYPSSFIEGVCNEYLLIKIDMQRGDRSRLSTSARRIPVQDFQWMNFAFMPWQAGWSLDRFHMTSRRPLLVTVKWRPCMCS